MPLFYGELQQAHLENLASDPGTPAVGRIWNNTASSKAKIYDGTDNKVLVTETGTATLTNKTLTAPVVNAPIIDAVVFDGQASTPATPAAGYYKVYVKDDGRAYMLNPAGLEAGLGGGGGGGSLKFLERGNSPVLEVENFLEVYSFVAGLSQELYAAIRVPQTYSPGSQINMRGLIYSADTSGDVLIRTQATLIRAEVDEVTSTTNQRTATNSAITMSAANDNEPQKVVWDLTSSSGQINAVSVSGGDLIVVRLYRDTDTATGDVKFIQLATEVSFS
jgi:hypothetical protein